MRNDRKITRALAFIICLSILLGFVPAGLPIETNQVNAVTTEPVYVFSDDFNKFNLIGTTANRKAGPYGWTDSDVNNQNLVRCYDGESAVEGHALHFQSANDLWAQSPMFDVKSGHDYTVEYMAKKSIDNTDLSGRVKLVFLDGNGTEVGAKQSTAGMTFGQWTKESFIGVAPSDAVTAYLLFSCATTSAAYGIDSLTVAESAEPSSLVPDGTEPSTTPTEPSALALKNGDFESGLDYWEGSSTSGATTNIVTDGAYNGHSILFTAAKTATDTAINARSQTLTIGDASALKLSVMSKLVSGTAKGYIGLWFYDASNHLVPENTAYTIPVGYTSDWHEDVLIQDVPAGAVTVKVEMGNPSNATCVYMLDDIKLTPYSSGNAPAEPTYVFTENFNTFNLIGTTPNRKAGPYGWTDSDVDNQNLVRCYDGSSAVEDHALHFQSADNLWAQSPTFTVKAGYDYTVAFMAKKSISNTDLTGRGKIVFLDANGVEIGAKQSTVGTNSAQWVKESFVGIAPDGAVSAYLVFSCGTAAGAYGIDSLTVAESAEPSDLEPDETEPSTSPTEPTDATTPSEGGNETYIFSDNFNKFNLVSGKEDRRAGPYGWTDSDIDNKSLVRCYDGSSAVEGHALHFQSADNLWACSPMFNVKAGYDYTVEFMAKKSDNNTIFTGFIKVVFIDANGEELSVRERYVGRTFGEWVKESVIAVAPENADKAYILFECRTAKGAYGVDNLTVTESDGPSERDPNATEPDDFPVVAAPEIKNGDFEEDLKYWSGSCSSGATVTVVTEGAYSGNSLLFTAAHSETDKAIANKYQTLEVGDYKAFQLSAVSKLVSGSAKAYIGLWFYDENDKLVPKNTAFTIPIGYTSDWHEDVLIQAVPEGAVTVKIEFGNSSNITSTYMIDNVKFAPYTGPEEFINPPYAPETPGEENTEIVIVDPSKLNASFEELDEKGMPIGWRTAGYGKFTLIKADDAPNGQYYAQIEKTEDGGITLCSPRISCTPNTTYELKVMARDLVGKCYLGIYVYDANGVCLEDASKIVSTDGSGKWKIYTVLAQLPANAAGIEFEAWASSKVTEYKIQVDAVMMRVSEEKIKEPYVPTEYIYPTVDELLENVSDVYPRVYFTPEEAKQIKLRRFNGLKTKYGWSWNNQYETLLAQADNYMKVEKVSVSMNTGKSIMMDIYPVLKDPNDADYKDIYIAASIDENGNMYELPYTGFGCLITDHLREMMKTWSLAYIMTGKAIYADRAIDFAMQIAQWDWWGDYYWTMEKDIEADASVAWMMEGMVAVYDMCHDRLTDEQIRILEQNIIEKGLIPLSKQVDPMDTSNGNMMYCGGILSGFAAIVNKSNAQQIYPYLKPGLLTMHNALDIYAFSGNTEGHYYTDYGLKTFMPGVGHLYRTTKLEGIIDHPFLTEILPYWTIMWASSMTGAHPNYSDSASLSAYMKIPMGVLSKLTNDPLIDGFLINAGGTGSVFNNFVYLNPDPQPEYLSDYAAVMDTLGYGALRTGFAANDMLLTLKANDSQMHHNHYDQNSIQFSYGGTWLIQDPGVGSYYYSNRLFWTHEGHSTILVDNNAQMELGRGSSKMVFNNNLYSYIIGSAAEAYGSDFDGKVLEKFDRHAIQVNHEDKAYYLLIDDLASNKNRVYTWQMYNGARQLFAVDGEDVPTETFVMGNKVSMPIGKSVLNVNFVDSEKLQIGDLVYKAGEQPVGMTLAANSAAAKTHQFMTLISIAENFNSNYISFYEILGGERFTNPERIEDGEISWDSSMPLGQEIVKGNMIGTTPCVFFRGNKAGDWIEIPFTIDETGMYDVNLTMGVSDGCCRVKATFDDTIESDIFDCSGLPETFIDIPFGEMELKAGEHKIKLEVAGPGLDEDYEPGWFLINAGGIDLMRVGVEVPVSNDMEVVEVIDNEAVIAGMVNYIENKFDFLMWNRTDGAVTAGLMNTDGKQASVLGLVDSSITEGFAATNATTLTYDSKVLFVAEKKVDIVASNTGWQITTSEAQTVKLTAIAPELDYAVTVNDETIDTKIENGILTIALSAGDSHIAIEIEEPAPTEPTKPATEPATTPTEPVVTEDNDNTALWIISSVAAILLVGAVTGIVLFLKKRKNVSK